MSDDRLLAAARRASERAYAPASRFPVGAAALFSDGRTFTGANVENASHGLTICAERVAILSGVAAGARRLCALAVVSGPGARLCGACRQVVREFADGEARLLLAAGGGSVRVRRLDELLPR